MGNFKHKIRVTSVDDRDFKHAVELEAWVDNGASFTVIPRKVSQQLGITPHRKEKVTLADGKRIERDVGMAFVELLDEKCGCEILLGEDSDAPLLGNTTMQPLGILIDTQSEKLNKRGYNFLLRLLK